MKKIILLLCLWSLAINAGQKNITCTSKDNLNRLNIVVDISNKTAKAISDLVRATSPAEDDKIDASQYDDVKLLEISLNNQKFNQLRVSFQELAFGRIAFNGNGVNSDETLKISAFVYAWDLKGSRNDKVVTGGEIPLRIANSNDESLASESNGSKLHFYNCSIDTNL